MIKKVKECWIFLITVLLIAVWLSHAGLRLGNTQEDHKNGFSIGADYEYRLTNLVGLGGIAEYVGWNRGHYDETSH